MTVLRGLAIASLVFLISCSSAPLPPGEPTVEELQLVSSTFGNSRTVRVLLPPGYHAPGNKRTYPVLYLNDGISVFRPTAIDIKTIIADLLRRGVIRPIIVAGIDNGASTNTAGNPGTDRAMEYLPYPDTGFGPDHRYAADPPRPRGAAYPAFLVDEVMPLLRRHYRVSNRMGDTAIGGFSYGGDAALYAVMQRPGVFGGLLLESTPLWIGENEELLNDVRRTSTWPVRVHIGVGTAETKDEAINARGLAGLKALEAAINRASPETKIQMVVEENAAHGNAAWRKRLPAGIEFLFPPGR